MADQGLRGELQEYRNGKTNSLASVANTFGEPRYLLPVLGASYLVGRLTGVEELERAAARAGEAAAVAGGLTLVIKHTLGRGRPNQGADADPDRFRPFSRWNSFPSGHTAVAFAVATSIAQQTGDNWSDAALYGVATLTGLARLNDDHHWASDVLAGAIIGHLSARWLSRHGLGVSLDF
jgi:membrane-associated phospholipid phosphatase